MAGNAKPERLYGLLAPLLDYPTPALGAQVQECLELLAPLHPAAAARLKDFHARLAGLSPGRVEEVYTATFDLRGSCYPYAGYHLCGQNHKWGLFLARLRQEYRQHGFQEEGELPDHLAVILRFLASGPGEQVRRVLVSECLVPALEKMLRGLEEDNPYKEVLQALLLVLQGPDQGPGADPGGQGGGEDNA